MVKKFRTRIFLIQMFDHAIGECKGPLNDLRRKLRIFIARSTGNIQIVLDMDLVAVFSQLVEVVVDTFPERVEYFERAARILRASRQNKEVFKAIYAGSKRFKSVEDLRNAVTNFNAKTYAAAARLFGEDIIEKKTQNGLIFYGKKDFYKHHRDRILRLSESLERIKKYPTKRKAYPQITARLTYTFRTKPKVKQIYVDDIDSFAKVRTIRKADVKLVQKMAERTINRALCSILNQSEKKDWAGERHDIYTNKMIFQGRRKSAAFALKGKAVKAKLTPGKMGKNGDQIPRLFGATADVYLVCHSRDIDDRVVDLMQTHSIEKSIAGNKAIFFCVIDGDDLARLAAVYPKEFGLR